MSRLFCSETFPKSMSAGYSEPSPKEAVLYRTSRSMRKIREVSGEVLALIFLSVLKIDHQKRRCMLHRAMRQSRGRFLCLGWLIRFGFEGERMCTPNPERLA